MPRLRGLRPIITWKIKQAIKLVLDEQLWYYQDKIVKFLLKAFNIIIH
jgi:hypothetical protein